MEVVKMIYELLENRKESEIVELYKTICNKENNYGVGNPIISDLLSNERCVNDLIDIAYKDQHINILKVYENMKKENYNNDTEFYMEFVSKLIKIK